MVEKILTLKELSAELGDYCSVNRLRQEVCRAEFTKFVNFYRPIRFLLNPESRKLLYDRLLSSKTIRKRVELGRKYAKNKKK